MSNDITDIKQTLATYCHRVDRGTPDEVAEFLIKRISRDMHSLFAMLDRLDRESLVAQKKLTIPFVKGLLEKN